MELAKVHSNDFKAVYKARTFSTRKVKEHQYTSDDLITVYLQEPDALFEKKVAVEINSKSGNNECPDRQHSTIIAR